MAETQAFPKEVSVAPVSYRRLSGLAITGFVLACLFAVALLVETVLAFRSQTPVMMPAWLQVIPFAASVLCLLSLFFIRTSEGTLAGAKLAIWGFWLGLIFGLSYVAYSSATFVALRQMSERFTLDWVEKIKQNKLNEAFLYTQLPSVRMRINPDDERDMEFRFNAPTSPEGGPEAAARSGMLDMFRARETVRILRNAGEGLSVRPLGVKDWEYKEGGYKIRQVYEIITPEAIHHLLVTTHGSTSPSGEFKGRQWVIVFVETQFVEGEVQQTALGDALGMRYSQSKTFIEDWVDELQQGHYVQAYLDTLPPADRAKVGNEFWARYAANAVTAPALASTAGLAGGPLQLVAAVPPDLPRQLYLPGYFHSFQHAGLIHGPKVFLDEEDVTSPLGVLKLILRPAPAGAREFKGLRVQPGSKTRFWQEVKGNLQLTHDGAAGFQYPNTVMVFGGVQVTAECGPDPFNTQAKMNWRIVSIEPYQETPRGPRRVFVNTPGVDTPPQ